MRNRITEPHVFVILGVTGDLARRKLIPAMFHLASHGKLHRKSIILGVGRRKELNDEALRDSLNILLTGSGAAPDGLEQWCGGIYYHSLGEGTDEDFRGLGQRIAQLEEELGLPGNRAFYLSLPPSVYQETLTGLGSSGLNQSKGWTRLVIEKPFGRDLASADQLNHLVHQFFDESQVYRIDHYLGKETVQNLLVFRFANPIFESLWNRDRVKAVQITVAEDLGVETRGGYYDSAGALRDMVQNHLTQLLSLIAMEVPSGFEAEAIRMEKVKVLKSLAKLSPQDAVMGQYVSNKTVEGEIQGYKEEQEIPEDSETETFAAIKVEVNNWRWQGVPFYLRTGKRMPEKLTVIDVVFREPPVCLFGGQAVCRPEANVLRIQLQPNEGFDLSFEVKVPGDGFNLKTQTLHFGYQDAFGEPPGAYETLLLDVIQGDQTLFVHSEEVRASWQFYSPLLEMDRSVRSYPAGTWGPGEADMLLEMDGNQWELT
jgi:glucose-6-phosphate 1-dehydrogenase